jgi:putative peptide zinc metalloprotease protein
MAFVLAAVTWISSLAINLSPFMRFDGYFLLMDALDIPNLHPRAFAMARWWLREMLFALGEDCPEDCGAGRRRFLILFAFVVWAYRLAVFLGIAVLVYHFFIKAVGIMLFSVEIAWFVVLPITREVSAWWARRAAILSKRRVAWPLAATLLLLVAVLLPWRGQIRAPAVMKAPDSVAIFLPTGAELQRQAATEGQAVGASDTLFVFDSADIRGRRSLVEARIATLEYQLRAASFDSQFREERSSLRDALAAATAERESLANEERRLTILAGHAGTLVDLLPNLHPGDSISPRERLAIVRGNGPPVIDAYVSEVDLSRVHLNDAAIFYPDALSRRPIQAHVKSIDRDTTAFLTDLELARSHGGEIAVRGKEGAPIPDGALYHLRLTPDGDAAAPIQLRGVARIAGDRQSLMAHMLRAAAAVVMREWGT